MKMLDALQLLALRKARDMLSGGVIFELFGKALFIHNISPLGSERLEDAQRAIFHALRIAMRLDTILALTEIDKSSAPDFLETHGALALSTVAPLNRQLSRLNNVLEAAKADLLKMGIDLEKEEGEDFNATSQREAEEGDARRGGGQEHSRNS